MTENTKQLLKKVREKGGNTFLKIMMITAIVIVISLLCMLIESLMALGIFGLMVGMCIGFYGGIYALAWMPMLSKCFKTLEFTGSLRYIDEIFNDQYNLYGKVAFSAHYVYVPGRTLIAYEDIVDISPYKVRYMFTTIDGKRHEVSIPTATLEGLLEQNPHILVNAPYKEYKGKIERFKTTGIKD